MNEQDSTIKILHIDEEQSFLDYFSLLFSGDFHITSTNNIENFFNLIPRIKPEAVIVDFNLPEMNGLELLSSIKKEYPHIPVIFCTGQGSEDVAREAFINGASDYFNKDFSGIASKEKFINSVKNLVEKQKTQKNLEDSENKYKTITENTNDIIYSINSEGKITYLNSRVKAYGYDPEMLIGKSILNLIAPEDREKIITDFEKTLSTGKEFLTTYRGIDKYGKKYWLEELGKVIRDEDNNIIGLTGIIRDISERKHFETALEEIQDQQVAMIDSMDDFIHLVSSDFKIILFNTAMKKVCSNLGFKMQPGDNLFEAFPFLNGAVYKEYEEVLKTGKTKASVEHLQFKDREFWIETRKIPVFDTKGKVHRIITILRDITNRKQDENAIVEMNTRLQTLIQAIPDIVYFKDTQGRNLIVNRSFERLANKEIEEIIGKTDEEIFPEELAKYCRESDESVKQSGETIKIEEKFSGENGNTVYFDTVKVPIYDHHKKISGLVGVSRDVTRQKNMKEALIQKNNELEDFAYRVSHDLKSPLHLIKGYISLLEEDNELCDSIVPKIMEQTDRVVLFIDKLLKLSRAGRIIGDKAIVNPEEMIRKAYEFFSESNSFQSELIINSSLPDIYCDSDACKQVFSNLVQNSFKYRNPDNGRLIIEVSGAVKNNSVEILVRDNGKGIEEKHINNIFNPGFALSKDKGTGFGLAIVKKIVAAHNGCIQVKSDGIGKGTEFMIKIPLKTEN